MNKFTLAIALLGSYVLALHPVQAAPPTKKPTVPAPTVIMQGRVKNSTKPPRPRSVPYKDAVIAVHLIGVKATKGKAPKEIIVLMWGMSNNRWTPAASYRPGQSVTLRLIPWEKVERKYGRYNRFELEDESTYDLKMYWAQP
jgi:hypothetical protein